MQGSKKEDLSFSIWYFITVVAYMVISQFQFGQYFIWIKPLPVLFMLMHLHSVSQKRSDLRFIQAGLFFGMIGDIILEVKGAHIYFLLGAGSFFVGHICYIIGFSKGASHLINRASLKGRNHLMWIYVVIIFGASAYNVYDCWDQLEDVQKFFVPIYSVVLSIMTSTAIGMAAIRTNDKQQTIGVIIFIGSFLFYISDSIIAQQRFDKDFNGELKTIGNVVVEISYWLAQFLIAQGAYRLSQVKTTSIKRDTLLTQSAIDSSIE